MLCSLFHDALQRIIAGDGKTVVVIAHRLSTVRSADVIFVVDEGEIAERGNHESLMTRKDGIYRKLVDGQLKIQATPQAFPYVCPMAHVKECRSSART